MIRSILPGFLYQSDETGAKLLVGKDSQKGDVPFAGVICAAAEVKVDYRRIPNLHLQIHEGYPTDPSQFDAAVVFFETIGHPILTHCRMGLNRSSAANAAILVGAFKAPLWRAVERTNPELPPALAASLEAWAGEWDKRKEEARSSLKALFTNHFGKGRDRERRRLPRQ